LITLAPWLLYTYSTTGSPQLTSQTATLLWKAHNAETFSYYPEESIDRSTDQAWARMSDSDARESKERKAIEYMKSHPAETLTGGFRKIAAGFSIFHNPRQGWPMDAIYTASYGPMCLLAVIGIWFSKERWREFLPIFLLVACFAAVTAVFWAHTSHRSYLDVYGIVFASHAVRRLTTWRGPV
jgi:hypothetical protein